MQTYFHSKDLYDKRVLISQYQIQFYKYLPQSFTLYGSNNQNRLFRLDEVSNPSSNVAGKFIINRTIDPASYFRYYWITYSTNNSEQEQKIELKFDEKKSIPYYTPIINGELTIDFEKSTDFCKKKDYLMF